MFVGVEKGKGKQSTPQTQPNQIPGISYRLRQVNRKTGIRKFSSFVSNAADPDPSYRIDRQGIEKLLRICMHADKDLFIRTGIWIYRGGA